MGLPYAYIGVVSGANGAAYMAVPLVTSGSGEEQCHEWAILDQ